MGKEFSLQALLDLSQLRLDEATRRLGELIAGEQEASKRLALLVEYRQEYRSRFLDAAKDGLPPLRWQNFQAFLGKLEVAIVQAEQVVEQTRARTQLGQREWLDKRGDVKTYDTLSERHAAKERYEGERREQKVQDEHAARLHQDSSK